MITPFASTPHGEFGAKVAVDGQQSVNGDRIFCGYCVNAAEIGDFPRWSTYRQIVDQARFSDPCRREKARGLPESTQSFKAVGVGQRDIIDAVEPAHDDRRLGLGERVRNVRAAGYRDRKSTRLNSSH